MDQQKHSLVFELGKYLLRFQPGEESNIKFVAVSLFCTIFEIILLIIISHILHLVLKNVGQPTIVSQMLAGIVIGPTLGSKANLLDKEKDILIQMASSTQVIFMFLIGLEIDVMYLKRTFVSAMKIVAGSAVICGFVNLTASGILYMLIHRRNQLAMFILAHFLIAFNTECPVLIRMVSELKLTLTPIGRLSLSVALLTDAVCVFLISFLTVNATISAAIVVLGIVQMAVVIGALFLMRAVIKGINKRNAYCHEVGDDTVFLLLLILFGVAEYTFMAGMDPMSMSFLVGLLVPRDGPTVRTMVQRLTYVVNNLILPIYFGSAGLQTDLRLLRIAEVPITVIGVIFLGILGKVGGTIVGARLLDMHAREGLALGLLLNVKGHFHLIVISFGKQYGIWDQTIFMALLMTVLFTNVIICPLASYVVRRERSVVNFKSRALERLNIDNELRILVCVHCPQEVPTILDLIEISNAPDGSSHLSPYILHLVELQSNEANSIIYNQLQEKKNDDNIIRDMAEEVNPILDTFFKETNINLHQLKAISCLDTMHEDVQHVARDVFASLVILPFHCKRKIDGRMGVAKENIREFNINVLRYAPCTVGILVDRGMGKQCNGVPNTHLSMSADEKMSLSVVIFFLGGPDDREAVSYAKRLAVHPCVNVTVMRFHMESAKDTDSYYRQRNLSTASSMAKELAETNLDDLFMENFHKKYVESGITTYIERVVEDSTDFITTLSSMAGTYSLYIVGRQVRGPAIQLTEGMGEWEEFPELGPIGDLLSSSDFMLNGSVLVIQQFGTTFSPTT